MVMMILEVKCRCCIARVYLESPLYHHLIHFSTPILVLFKRFYKFTWVEKIPTGNEEETRKWRMIFLSLMSLSGHSAQIKVLEYWNTVFASNWASKSTVSLRRF